MGREEGEPPRGVNLGGFGLPSRFPQIKKILIKDPFVPKTILTADKRSICQVDEKSGVSSTHLKNGRP